jgi:hypothetical protein
MKATGAPVIAVPIVNHYNNQPAADENLRPKISGTASKFSALFSAH